jgi:hypothetical protein
MNAKLYLLPNTVSYSSVFLLRDENNNPISGFLVIIQRYYTGTNTYNAVAMCKSDSPDGKCTTFMRILDVFYRYLILDSNNDIVKETTPSALICKPFESMTSCPPYPIAIPITTREVPEYYQRIGTLSSGCTLNETSHILSCSYTDISGKIPRTLFVVKKMGGMLWDTLCNQTSTSASATYTCDLGTLTNNQYYYYLIGYYSPPMLMANGQFDFLVSPFNWGVDGNFLALIIICVFFFMGIWNPTSAMVMAVLGIGVTTLLGLTPVSWISVIGLFIVVVFAAWRMRT